MHTRLAVSCLALTAGLAIAQQQVKQPAFSTQSIDPSDPRDLGSRPVDGGVGVNAEAVVVTSNMRLRLFARTGGQPLADFGVEDATFPFKKVDVPFGRFFDPRVEYDKANDRLWMMYVEDNIRFPGGSGELARIHLAVSQAIPAGGLNSFNSDDWHFFTGIGASGTDGDALNLGTPIDPQTDPRVTPFRINQGHNPLATLADLPAMAIDERAIYLTPYSRPEILFGQTFGTVAIIPLEHSNGSLLNGDRPDESDIIMLWRSRLASTATETFVPDNSIESYAVQEPFEQFANAQFFASHPVESGLNTGIRLAGLWYDDAPGTTPENERWKFEQRLNVGQTALDDMALNPNPVTANALRFFDSGSYNPQLPMMNELDGVTSAFYTSAVLVRDANNNPRIFAAHHATPSDTSLMTDAPANRYVVQWYVIDPDLTNFRTTTPWNPVVVASGRLDAGTGDRYHPTIGVTPQGQAHIQYTYSDTSTYPQIRQVVLNNTYTAPGVEITVQAGPAAPFTGTNFWADYADMQADPLFCGFWSVHTLVKDADERNAWLFFLPLNCQSPELNGEGGTDLYDLAMFNNYYSTGARRVDMNTDGTTDATDAAIYLNEYDKATGP
ncbi:MAG: hypothetical protein NCW75_07865 [Phycisphaera sp.]|nr:MAG: hypothetical protein NCW75_07865 [Phycisphaera sp.]